MEVILSSVLSSRLGEIKKFSPNWYIYAQDGTLTEREVDELIKFDSMDDCEKQEYFECKDSTICVILIKLLSRVTVDRILQSVLLLLNRLILPQIQTTRHFLDMLKKVDFDVYAISINLLCKEDDLTCRLASKLASKLVAYGYQDHSESFVTFLCKWVKKKLEVPVFSAL